MKKKLDHESMMAYFREGHTAKEVAERFDTSAGYAKKICRGIRSGNQYTNGLFDRDANAKKYIDERTPWFEFAGNFTGVDGYVDLKCKKCGTVTSKSFVSVKHGSAVCTVCKAEENRQKREATEAKRKAKREADKRTRQRTAGLNKKAEQVKFNQCLRCGELFITTNKRRKYCSTECLTRSINAISKDRRIKKMRAVIVDRGITLEKLYERDRGVCHICGQLCDWNDYEIRSNGAFVARDKYPSIDHLIPLSKKGKHSWANIKLAHFKCNTDRGNSSLSA